MSWASKYKTLQREKKRDKETVSEFTVILEFLILFTWWTMIYFVILIEGLRSFHPNRFCTVYVKKKKKKPLSLVAALNV